MISADRKPAEMDAKPRAHVMRHRWLMGSAAALALMIGAAAWLAFTYEHAQVFDTAPGEQRSAIFTDGSHLDIAPDSKVSIHFTFARRDVEIGRGQAFFIVAHSALRPFVVRSGGLTVTAQGTAFDVRTGQARTVVTVSKGHVKVSPASNEDVRAGAGERVTFEKAARQLSVASVDLEAAESWRRGILEFDGQSLDDVANEINRYSARRVVVSSTVEHMRFTGTVSFSDLSEWLEALPQIFFVEVSDQGAGEINIRSREIHDTKH